MTAETLNLICQRAATGRLLKHVDEDFVIYNRKYLFENAAREFAISMGETELKPIEKWQRAAVRRMTLDDVLSIIDDCTVYCEDDSFTGLDILQKVRDRVEDLRKNGKYDNDDGQRDTPCQPMQTDNRRKATQTR